MIRFDDFAPPGVCSCDPVTAVVAGSAILGAGVSAKQASKSRKLAKQTNAANEQQALKSAQRSEEQFNKLNQKQPGIAALLASNKGLASKGLGSTFLTGPKGISTKSLPLGGSSLLGG